VNEEKTQTASPVKVPEKRRAYASPRIESEPVTERYALYSCGGGNNDAPYEYACCAAVPS